MDLEFPIDLSSITIHSFEELKEEADRGNPEALNLMGECLFYGYNTEKNSKNAVICYQKAALKENVNALVNLGNLYENGIFLNKDIKLAEDCYICAYNLGEIRGLYNLGLMYINLERSDDEVKLGIAMIKKAADNSDMDAEYYWNEYYAEDYSNQKELEYKKLWKGSEVAGIVFGNISNASTLFGTEMFNSPKGAVGFAAERANHLYDTLTGHNTVFIGDEIDPLTGTKIKNGADRIVDGVQIQTKYFASGEKSVTDCFSKDGNKMYKYLNSDGSPMVVEVPKDKYPEAIAKMKEKIAQGKVPGVTDPDNAEQIVKKGRFTHKQALRIAQAGTVESITYDMANGAIVSSYAFGISSALAFASSVWNGEDYDTALSSAVHSGLKVSGATFATAVLSSQLSRAGLNSALVGSTDALTKLIGSKGSAVLANAFRSGKNIYGVAATKYTSKMLRGNVITGIASIVVLSSVDIFDIFQSRISGAQLFKNVANTTSSVAGGTAGWIMGSSIGSVIPVVGTFIGGVVGSAIGGTIAGKASSAVLNEFIEDDANEMIRIIEKVFTDLAEEFLLTRNEAEDIVDDLKNDLSGGKLKEMFASSNKKKFANDMLIQHFIDKISQRKKVSVPSLDEMEHGLRKVLEDIADSMEDIAVTE